LREAPTKNKTFPLDLSQALSKTIDRIFQTAKVWSMVALIYNTFMVYIPTANEKEEGLLTEPVMCTTTR
jgi:hypothetical protein